jgi:hypothetical protein
MWRWNLEGVLDDEAIPLGYKGSNEKKLGGLLSGESVRVDCPCTMLTFLTIDVLLQQALSDWMLGLPPHIRLKDVFQAETTRRDPITGMVSTVPFLSTPFTVILEQYRLLDSKIVEHLERKDTSLDEFELELKNRLQAGLNQLINTESAAMTTSSDIETRAEPGALLGKGFLCSCD